MRGLCQEMQISLFVESPPVALLFAECDWKDWISQEYPAKYRTGAEWEIRQEIYKIPRLLKHVCGKVLEKAMYIDGVTREDQIPWYELVAGNRGRAYETYKLNP